MAIGAVALLIVSPAFAAQLSTGFATYQVTLTTPTGQHTVLVNETVKVTDKPGFSDLILQLTGGTQNLTYSRLVNSSMNLLPYLPSIPSQSVDYSNGTKYNVQANFTAGGTKPLIFKGTQYTLSVYTIVVHATLGNRTVDANGTVAAFPSSLVYSASFGSGGKSVEVFLVGTDLPLAQTSTQTMMAAYIGAGLGVGGAAFATVFIVRRREKRAQNKEQKPLHWVD